MTLYSLLNQMLPGKRSIAQVFPLWLFPLGLVPLWRFPKNQGGRIK